MSVEIPPEMLAGMKQRSAGKHPQDDVPLLIAAHESLQAAHVALRAEYEASQARVRELETKCLIEETDKWIDLHAKAAIRAEQAEARVAVLREALSAYGDESLRDPLTGLEAAADRLLSERKLLRSIAAIANSISDCVTEFGKETDGACACHEYFEHMDTALTALHEFDDKETK